MIYYTIPRNPKEKQVTLDDVLFNFDNENLYKGYRPNLTNQTITYEYRYPDYKWFKDLRYTQQAMIARLHRFNEAYADLRAKNVHSLYRVYKIPKKSGGLRTISEPCLDLKIALTQLRQILEDFGAMHHASAYAYVKNRCSIDALKIHRNNESNWFMKTDLTDFFGTTTLDFVMKQISHIWPFCAICFKNGSPESTGDLNISEGYEELKTALSLGFLDGGLPQGSPLSPAITNLIMIPIDYTLLSAFSGNKLVYTRYADDMLISGKEKFPQEKVIEIINAAMKKYNAPYVLKKEKTRYGSRAGQNWNLGLMLNKDNNITVGHKNKKIFKGMANNFILDTLHGKSWPVEDIQHMYGLLSYYRNVEKDYFNYIISKMNEKYNVNFYMMVKTILKN